MLKKRQNSQIVQENYSLLSISDPNHKIHGRTILHILNKKEKKKERKKERKEKRDSKGGFEIQGTNQEIVF